jgi:predicted nucleotidyltransferase
VYVDWIGAMTSKDWPVVGPAGGRYFEMTPCGYIANIWDETPIQEEWRPLVDDAVVSVTQCLGGDLDSIYLRGSVAEGRARFATSDLDLVVISRSPTHPSFSWPTEELHRRHPFTREVSIETCALGDLRTDPRLSYMRVVLKVQCRLLHGIDRRYEMKRARPGWEMVFAAHTLEDRHARFVALRETGSDRITLDRRTQSFFRAALRSGFELYEDEIGRFTRDIDLCAQVLAVAQPSEADLFHCICRRTLQPAQRDDVEVAARYMEWFLPTRKQRLVEEVE